MSCPPSRCRRSPWARRCATTPPRAAGTAGPSWSRRGGAGGRGREAALGEQVVEQYFAPGDRVLHATLGEGTVLSLEHGGIVLVRFENDGSERRLMASVAPLKKLRG